MIEVTDTCILECYNFSSNNLCIIQKLIIYFWIINLNIIKEFKLNVKIPTVVIKILKCQAKIVAQW